MKAIYSCILLLLAVFAFTHCVKEDLDDCPPDGIDYNLILNFEYFDKEDADIFDNRIYCIDVILYDENHNLYQWIQADDDIPERTKSLHVDPGTYYIVSWANDFNDRETRQNAVNLALRNTYIYHNISKESTNELHYAPDLRNKDRSETQENLFSYTVTVAPEGVTEYMVSYMSAHRTVNVYLKGFYEMSMPDTDPEVSITNLTEYYDNFLNRGSDNVSYNKKAEEIIKEEEKLGYAGFVVPHFDNESPVTVEVTGKYSTGTEYHFSVTMDEILKELDLIVEDGDDAVIDIVIELKGTYVEVKVPKWLVVDVEPGFNN